MSRSTPGYHVVYLLHFSHPYKHARHYLGWTTRLYFRLDEHRQGKGAALTAAAVGDGIILEVARLWRGKDRYYEKKLRLQKANPKLCPICNPGAANRASGKRSAVRKGECPF
jgi:hypothetical protein